MFDHLSDEPDFRFENWKNEASAEEIKNKKDENENWRLKFQTEVHHEKEITNQE